MSRVLFKALAFTVVLLLAGSASVAKAQPVTNTDPDAARLVTEDIPRFWAAYDAAAAEDSADARAESYQRLYLAPGSAGLRAFLEFRISDAGKLVATIDKHPATTHHCERIPTACSAMKRRSAPRCTGSRTSIRKPFSRTSISWSGA